MLDVLWQFVNLAALIAIISYIVHVVKKRKSTNGRRK